MGKDGHCEKCCVDLSGMIESMAKQCTVWLSVTLERILLRMYFALMIDMKIARTGIGAGFVYVDSLQKVFLISFTAAPFSFTRSYAVQASSFADVI